MEKSQKVQIEIGLATNSADNGEENQKNISENCSKNSCEILENGSKNSNENAEKNFHDFVQNMINTPDNENFVGYVLETVDNFERLKSRDKIR